MLELMLTLMSQVGTGLYAYYASSPVCKRIYALSSACVASEGTGLKQQYHQCFQFPFFMPSGACLLAGLKRKHTFLRPRMFL